MKTSPLFPRLSILLWLMATLILVVLPHMLRLAWWISLAFFALLLWRYVMTRKQWQLPSPRLQFSLALLILLGLSLSYGTWFGRDASIALLVILCGLKLLEMKNQRDVLLLCFLSYFLIITHFLYSQSIPTALYMGIVMLVATATLISLSDTNNSLSISQRFRLSGTLLMQAIPVMLVLFVLFPRVAGPFWQLPKDAGSGITGLSDSMSLGNVSKLSLSNEIAFRVKFEGKKPSPKQLYWRGPVLWWTNGRDWETGIQHYRRINQINLHPTGKPFDYTITLEPHHEHWLFALDLPLKAPAGSYVTPDYQMLTMFPVRQLKRYQLSSHTEYRADIFTYQQNRLSKQLPKNKHPRARALAKKWLKKNPQPEAIVQRALQYFNQEPFNYTYTPALLFDDPIDEFLFETRTGFCEHYAAAFTVLMRAAGTPARIVTGYMGGTVNPIGDYLIVRQRDAHAWSEVWLQGKGWVRVDPTGAIAPERIEQGIDSALPTAFNPLGFEIDWQKDSTALKMWQQVRNTWDAVNNGWNQWVLGYGPTRQKKLLDSLGLKGIDWRGMTTFLIIIIGSLLLIYAAWMFLRSPLVMHDPAQQVYLRFCKKLARHGLLRLSHEGPLTYADRVTTKRPDLAVSIQKIIELYIQTRYRSQFETLKPLRKAVRRFRP
jgi:transglutaminase-like putative cysteine protease